MCQKPLTFCQAVQQFSVNSAKAAVTEHHHHVAALHLSVEVRDDGIGIPADTAVGLPVAAMSCISFSGLSRSSGASSSNRAICETITPSASTNAAASSA